MKTLAIFGSLILSTAAFADGSMDIAKEIRDAVETKPELVWRYLAPPLFPQNFERLKAGAKLAIQERAAAKDSDKAKLGLAPFLDTAFGQYNEAAKNEIAAAGLNITFPSGVNALDQALVYATLQKKFNVPAGKSTELDLPQIQYFVSYNRIKEIQDEVGAAEMAELGMPAINSNEALLAGIATTTRTLIRFPAVAVPEDKEFDGTATEIFDRIQKMVTDAGNGDLDTDMDNDLRLGIRQEKLTRYGGKAPSDGPTLPPNLLKNATDDLQLHLINEWNRIQNELNARGMGGYDINRNRTKVTLGEFHSTLSTINDRVNVRDENIHLIVVPEKTPVKYFGSLASAREQLKDGGLLRARAVITDNVEVIEYFAEKANFPRDEGIDPQFKSIIDTINRSQDVQRTICRPD